jgi:hypothetical protein
MDVASDDDQTSSDDPNTSRRSQRSSSVALRQVYRNRFASNSTNSHYRSYLSGDASIMLWTEPRYHWNEPLFESGRVRTFAWDCEAATYKEIADPIHGTKLNQRFGMEAQLSDNGRVLLVQSGDDKEGEIEVYHWTLDGWISMLQDPVSFYLLCREKRHNRGYFPVFSMDKEGTAFAVMTAHVGESLEIAVFRWEKEEWKDTYYRLPLKPHVCEGKIGIAISEGAKTTTFYGAEFGILQTHLNTLGGMIKPSEHEPVFKVYSEPSEYQEPHVSVPPNGEYPEFYASVVGNAVLYSMAYMSTMDGQRQRVGTGVLVEREDGEWVALYNKTGTTTNAVQVALQANIALIYGNVTARDLTAWGRHEWKVMLRHSVPHGGGGTIELSGDGSLLSVVHDDGYMSLYSLHDAIV